MGAVLASPGGSFPRLLFTCYSALVAAGELGVGTLRWLQRMYVGLEHCAGCSGCYALVAAGVLRMGRV